MCCAIFIFSGPKSIIKVFFLFFCFLRHESRISNLLIISNSVFRETRCHSQRIFRFLYCCDLGVSLTLCCFVVYSTRRFVLSLALYYFGLVFFSPCSIAITSLGEERANLSAFRTFIRFALLWVCLFPLPLDVSERLRLVIMALLPFLKIRSRSPKVNPFFVMSQ